MNYSPIGTLSRDALLSMANHLEALALQYRDQAAMLSDAAKKNQRRRDATRAALNAVDIVATYALTMDLETAIARADQQTGLGRDALRAAYGVMKAKAARAARAARDAEIRRRARLGAPHAALAAEYDLSAARVGQIAKARPGSRLSCPEPNS